ncbi:MAG: TonB-dependent receptor [Burkholderiales bacterium]
MIHSPLHLRRMVQSVAGAVAFMGLATSAAAQSDSALGLKAPEVLVTGIVPASLEGVPGSVSVVSKEDIERLQPPTIKEVLRLTPGVHVVDEDALGVNLNIGVRGLNPRRSSRTLLLEDGMPIHLAPYSDPSAHYHPPVERVERLEVLKGSGQIVHGPQTVGGVINFITRRPPAEREAQLRLAGGNQGFGSIYARYGNGDQDKGFAVDFVHKQIDGSRDKYEHKVTDVALSGRFNIADNQRLFLKGGHYIERSKTAEWGITDAQFATDPYGNPFNNDVFDLDRTHGHAVHELDLADNLMLSTRAYFQRTFRASYRQIDDSEDRMTAGGAGSGCTTNAERDDYSNADNCGNKQRPRNYFFWGVEPRIDWTFDGFGAENHLVAGVRYHHEDVIRRRYNGSVANARADTPGTRLRDWNEIETKAYSAFAQNTFTYGALGITPGVRVERIESKNTATVLGFAADGRSISDTRTEVLPGLGATYQAAVATTVFGGVHQGFAPPRPDANLSPVDPALVPVDPEKSLNYELGIRTAPRAGVMLEATLFRIEFEDQIVPGASVGLPLQTFANAGETLHQGFELGWRLDFGEMQNTTGNLYFVGAYTHVADAEFSSDRISGGQNINGNRLPYAPEHLLSASVGYALPWGLDMRVGLEHISEQFTDELNTVATDGSGQAGVIPSVTTYNFAINYDTSREGLSVFLAGTNLADKTYIVSRVDGIQVSRPRTVFGGIGWKF